MPESTRDRTIALVTGANKGIGRAIVAELAAHGLTVLLAARDPQRRDQAVAALQAEGGDVHPLALDVTDQRLVDQAAEDVEARYGRLDVLVNNAGISGDTTRQTPSQAPLDLVRQVFETNVFGVIRVTNAMLPLLRRSTAGRIVNVSSHVGSLRAMTDPSNYLAQMPASLGYPPSKTALNALTVQYAKEFRNDGILVNAAAPGACATDFTKPLGLDIPRTAADGASIAVRLATLPDDGPTGSYFDHDGPVPW